LHTWIEAPSPLVLEQARVLQISAEALWEIGDRASAVARAQEGLRIYERLGARLRVTRLEAWIADRAARRPGRPRSALPGSLTEREMETLQLIVRGRSNQEIADELVVSLGTAKKHVENIMSKAGVSRRTELVPFAVSIGVLATEDLRTETEHVRRHVIRLEPAGRSVPLPVD